MRYFYSDDYNYGGGLPLKQVHGFLLDKPRQIQLGLMAELGLTKDDFEPPLHIDESALRAVHSDAVLDGLTRSSAVARAAELAPLSLLPAFLVRRAVVSPQLCALGGTCAAVDAAAAGEWALNLSGGYHHARPDLSHGFCLVNDVAMALHRLRQRGDGSRVLVLDLDLHQGDGNAVALAEDTLSFTASLHEAAAFPHPKVESDLDVALASGIEDAEYLETLDSMLTTIAGRFIPELIVFVAGSDPYVNDPLGSLQISRAGMLARDERVGRFALEHGSALVALPAGGYCEQSPAINAAGFAALARLAP